MLTVKEIDLSAAFNNKRVVEPDNQIGEFFFLEIPPGVSFKMRVGGGGDYFTVTRPFSVQPQGELSNGGIYITNLAAQPGVVVELILVPGGEKANVILT